MTLLIHKGYQLEEGSEWAKSAAHNKEEQVIKNLLLEIQRENPFRWHELVKEWRTRQPFALEQRAGIRVCEAMARRGVLTRPIGNVLVLMPPYCTTRAQAVHMVTVLADSVKDVFRV